MSRRRRLADAPPVARLRADWPSCMARGLCHEVLPELIDLDEWGYPIINGPVTRDLLEDAREAVKVCPQLALRLIADRP